MQGRIPNAERGLKMTTLESCEIKNMKPEEIRAEWEHRKIERLGIMIDGTREATKLEILRAEICADEIIKL